MIVRKRGLALLGLHRERNSATFSISLIDRLENSLPSSLAADPNFLNRQNFTLRNSKSTSAKAEFPRSHQSPIHSAAESNLKPLKGSPEYVKVVEVGPRDGLQNEKKTIPTSIKVEFIKLLASSGLPVIEATSFVSPNWVPQLADAKEVMESIRNIEGVRFPVLIPNMKGIEAALECGAKEIAIFASASEGFSKANINCTIEESLIRYKGVADLALRNSIPVRGYVSCVVGCPIEGKIEPSKVAYVAKRLVEMGCEEVSMGDTIGVGTTGRVVAMLESVLHVVPVEKIGVHFHDTYGQALANILAALQMGIGTVDSSVGGLGGCPYAKGASGNVATEDVLYMLEGMGVRTGVDLQKVAIAGDFICKYLGRQSASKVAVARRTSVYTSKL